jgi:hypothetical protein
VTGCTLPARTRNLSGEKHGRLTCIEPLEKRRNGHVVYLCRCECGREVSATCSNLKSGHTQSCGCLTIERTKAANTKHGRSRTKLYRVWRQMKNRCELETAPNYKWYGARGIRVCDRWRDSFETFLADMGEPPEGYQIDRIDSNGDYEPANCRWADRKTQYRNTRRNVWVTFNGVTAVVSDWEKAAGSKDKIGKRLRRGMSVDDALGDIEMENLP